MNFVDKTVLITGAASGIGNAIAKNFAKLSANLSLLDINKDNLYKVAEECENLSKITVIKFVIDVSNDTELKQAVNETVKELNKIDVLINCAGILSSVNITDSDILEVYDKVLRVNLRSVIAATHFAAPALIESKGCIVNISSVMSKLVCERAIPYNVSKAGITHLTKCVALELAKYGVRVNCIAPGIVRTNILENNGYSKERRQEIEKSCLNKNLIKQIIKAEEIAELAAYLASNKAVSITGTEFVIDCGMTIFSQHCNLN
ncbi:unnamed protein product, partial [Brenthis ino]